MRKTWVLIMVLGLAACGEPAGVPSAPANYKLRTDLCDVLDYSAFQPLFGHINRDVGRGVATDAKVDCPTINVAPSGINLVLRTAAFRYDSAADAKKVFDRNGGRPSDVPGFDLKAKVDDVRAFKAYRVYVLDRNLYLEVAMGAASANKPAHEDEMPKLAQDFTDQVVALLRKAS